MLPTHPSSSWPRAVISRFPDLKHTSTDSPFLLNESQSLRVTFKFLHSRVETWLRVCEEWEEGRPWDAGVGVNCGGGKRSHSVVLSAREYIYKENG